MQHNIKLFLFVAVFGLLLGACNEYEEENFSFENGVPQYIEFSEAGTSVSVDTFLVGEVISTVVGEDTVSIADLAPTSIDIPVKLRVARGGDVNAEISITGDVNASGTVTIPAGSLTSSLNVVLPYGPNALNGSATATIQTVSDGLTIGRTTSGDPIDIVSYSIDWASE